MNHFWSGYRNPRLSKARDILLRASITRTPDARHNAAKIRLFASVVQIQRSPDPQQPSSSYFQQPTTNNDPIPNTYFETPNSAPLPPPPSPPPRGQRRYLRAALWAGLSFMLGYAWYEFLASPALLPNSYPAPGSLDDEAMRADIASLGSRAKAQRELESSDEWERQSNDEDIALFKTGFLASTGCVPYHALWLNRRKTGLVCFLHLGGALSSFPWTVHGGAISTVCSEICQKFVDIRTKTLASEVSRTSLPKFCADGFRSNLDLEMRRLTIVTSLQRSWKR
ncbi:MAG: hypothetical protein M4579_001323 [Chaenotheca gracillima]|nr:MAG: hypothetical protein M4579_001323 [Chaenotheca gracillima]